LVFGFMLLRTAKFDWKFQHGDSYSLLIILSYTNSYPLKARSTATEYVVNFLIFYNLLLYEISYCRRRTGKRGPGRPLFFIEINNEKRNLFSYSLIYLLILKKKKLKHLYQINFPPLNLHMKMLFSYSLAFKRGK